jgi:hypothetical protein
MVRGRGSPTALADRCARRHRPRRAQGHFQTDISGPEALMRTLLAATNCGVTARRLIACRVVRSSMALGVQTSPTVIG